MRPIASLPASIASLAAALSCAGPVFALEKTAVRMIDEDRARGWTASVTCSIAYFNLCTGWIWIWSGWAAGSRIGVCYEICCEPSAWVDAAGIFTFIGAPPGYGFTGVASIAGDWNDDCCVTPNEVVATQPYLPTSGWNTFLWGQQIGTRCITMYEHGPSPFPNPTHYGSDQPSAGPTGPPACGTCFPATRATHSFFYGTGASPLCPGSPLNDGLCDAEFLSFAALTCAPLRMEESSWGHIKSLYR